MEYKIECKFNKDTIELTEGYVSDEFEHRGVNFGNIVTNIVNLREDAIRQALIKLGWTPPKSEGESE